MLRACARSPNPNGNAIAFDSGSTPLKNFVSDPTGPCYPPLSFASGSHQKECFMRFFARIIALPAVVLLALTGCDQPTAPAAPQVELAVALLEPANGATLTAEFAALGFSYSDKIRLVFDVQLNRDMPVELTATFYADSQRCAVARSDRLSVRANIWATFEMNLVYLDLNGDFFCPLPQRTTKMVVELWQTQPNQTFNIFTREGAQLLLTRELAHGYTFVLE
jgi:hypothetical protein